jgi:F-type H+-transporting ATPase subunit b
MQFISFGIVLADAVVEKSAVQIVPDTLLFSFIIFGALLAILYKFAWGPIVEGLELREKRMADEIEGAQAANAEAQSTLAAYNEKMAGAESEAAALIAEAKSDAAEAKDRILADASAEAQRTKDRAVADIAAAKNAAVRELAESSVDSAVTLAGSIVGRSLDKNDHKDLIEKSIGQFNAG